MIPLWSLLKAPPCGTASKPHGGGVTSSYGLSERSEDFNWANKCDYGRTETSLNFHAAARTSSVLLNYW